MNTKTSSDVGGTPDALREQIARLEELLRVRTSALERETARREQVEAALQETQLQLDALFNGSRDGIALVKLDKIVKANLPLAQMCGYEAAHELSGLSVMNFVAPENWEMLAGIIQKRARGESAPLFYELLGRRRDGTTLWVEVTVTLCRLQGETFSFAVLHDITTRKDTEAALRKSETLLSRSQAIAHVGSWELDLETEELTWSDEAYRIFGLQSQKTAITYATFLDAVHPDDRPVVDAAYADSLQEGRGVYRVEHRIIQPASGEIRVVQERGEHIKDATGRVIRSIGMVQDITERWQAEQIIQLRLKLLDYAVTHSLGELIQYAVDEIGAITHSPMGFYHFVAADQKTISFQTWSTRTLQEGCSTKGAGLHYNVDRAGVWADCLRQRQTVIHNDYAALPHRRDLPDGHPPLMRELVVPTFREGRIVSVLGLGNKATDYSPYDVELADYVSNVIWDMVEHKRIEVQVQDYRNQLEAQNFELRKLLLAIEQSGSMIVITDAEGAIEYTNPYFEQATGYTRNEVLGKNPRILKSGEHPHAYYKELWQTICSGRSWRGELRNRRKDGALYWESATISPVHDFTGKITHYIATKEDITPRKQSEAALTRYAGRLEMLHELGDAILAARSPEDTAQVAIAYLQEIIPHTHVWVVELDNSTGARRFLAGQLADGRPLASITENSPAAAWPAEPFELLNDPDNHWQVYTEPAQLPPDSVAYLLMTDYDARSYYSIRLQVQQQWIGLLNLALTTSSVLTLEDQQVVLELANSLAIALHQARLYAQIQEGARIKADLLHEVNHRVSNNLMAIIGLMHAEGRYAAPDSRAVVEATLERLIQRVEGLAEVHRMLSQSQWSPVLLNDLATKIIRVNRRLLPAFQTMTVDISPTPVIVSPRQAGYLALIINELVTNTIKYAFTECAAVEVTVHWVEEDNIIHFEYRDDGPGYPEAVLRLEKYDVGLYLIQQMARSLDGVLSLRNVGGAVTAIVFNAEDKSRT
jgi:PAS domain S-box-containing protein